jgi:hypothetical protein
MVIRSSDLSKQANRSVLSSLLERIMKPTDAPAALVMGVGMLGFGMTMILRPASVRASFDRFADSWKQDSWHPYKMPFWALRLAGAIVSTISLLFFYIAYMAWHRRLVAAVSF